MNPELLKQNIEALDQQGASEADIQEYIDSVSVSSASAQPKKVGGFQGFAQAVARPFLKPIASVGALLEAGNPENFNKIQTEGLDFGYFGKQTPVGAGFEVTKGFTPENVGAIKNAVGTGAELGSYLVGGGGTASVGKELFKGGVKTALKEGAITGAVAGGSGSFGQAMQDAESTPMDVAYQTLFGTAIGTGAGLVAPAIGALGVKGAKAVSETASTLTNESDAIASLASKYDDFLGMTARQSKIEERYAKDTPRFLAEEFRGELPLSVSNGTRDLTEAKEFVRNKYQAEANAFNTVLKDSGVYGSIDDMAKEAKRLARQEFSGTDLDKALNNIDQEANAFRAQYAADAVYDTNGRQLIPIHQIDEIKKYQWERVKRGFNSPDGALLDDTDFLLGKAAQGQIESKVSDAPIKKWNKRLGDFASAMKILDSRDKLAVKNRFLNRVTGRIVGAMAGGASAGPLGSIPAAITGDWLALQLSNPEVNTYFIKQALKRIPASRRAGIVEEAQQILNSFETQRAQTLRLPAPSPLGSARNPIITPAPTTYEAPAQRIMNQSQIR